MSGTEGAVEVVELWGAVWCPAASWFWCACAGIPQCKSAG